LSHFHIDQSIIMSEEKSPWKILGEKKVYDNNWINVTEFDVINPSGGKGIYGKVHFKNLAVGAIVLDEKMNTYLVGQYRFPLNQYSWEIPEGGGDLSDPLISAQRELIEETGLVATKWHKILDMHLSNSVTDEYAVIYLATGLQQKKSNPDETEKLAVKKMPFEEVYEMLQRGLITDSMSVAAIQKVKLMLLEGSLEKIIKQ
jgi:8-oxo-dGTP pyrophosphatase MutT (NUDIX family)